MASIRWADLNKYSLVLVEFGNHKDSLNYDDENSYDYGINLGCEFCYKHMAIVVGKEVKADEILVVPLTTYKQDDENYPTNIIIDTNLYGHMVQHKTTIKINHLRSIDKKKRIKKIIKTFVSKTLQLEIEEKMRKFIG